MQNNHKMDWWSRHKKKSFLFPILLSLLYVFDEQINSAANTNFIGSLVYCLATLFVFNTIVLTKGISLKLGAMLFVLTVVSLLAYSSSYGCSVEMKGAFSLLLLWLMALTIQIAPLAEIVTMRSLSNIVLALVLSFICLDSFGIHLLSSGQNSGTYYEPSHVAMYLIPFIAYRLLMSARDFLSWITIVVILLATPSSTFLIGLVGINVLWLIKNQPWSHSAGKLQMLFIVVIILIMVLLADTTETLNRLIGIFGSTQTVETINLSSMVWLNGWSQAYEHFIATRGLGVGFNQMGCGHFQSVGRYSSFMLSTVGTVLNFNDGSFMAAKLISEFGLFGFLLIVIFVYLSVKAIFSLKMVSDDFHNHSITLARAVGGMCLISLLFVRSAGYFQLPVILTISLLICRLPIRAPVAKW